LLPDYTRAKKQLHQVMMEALQKRIRFYLGHFALKKYRAFEGRSFATKTEDGKVLKSDPKELSGKVAIKFEDIQSDDPMRILAHLDKIAREIAESQTKALFDQLGKTCAETGQTIDFGGKPLTVEMLFQTMENMLIEFDKDGKANKLTFVFGPQLTGRVKEILEELETNSDLKKQYDNLMERKRLQWRDREASRKLVG